MCGDEEEFVIKVGRENETFRMGHDRAAQIVEVSALNAHGYGQKAALFAELRDAIDNGGPNGEGEYARFMGGRCVLNGPNVVAQMRVG